ncbi:MAG: hypothetical protein COW30_06925 [Rhodospirillales bacterium CG15_BIG_FIL_POST_REV_8_21_14_020_66_15]|nr:MAG: hypothetical protein COW30_06925 [Rhodospirillales bacterium CG15_BIG_FIL_POST_REV_8_21_14_020_66_15]
MCSDIPTNAANVSVADQRIIDVWEVRKFDANLLAQLEENEPLITGYFEAEKQIFLSHDLGRDPRRSMLRPSNPYAHGFLELKEMIGLQMEMRTIRAFHYTRLTDDEVENILEAGIQVSTPETLRQRLDAIVSSGILSVDVADQLFAESPFHSDQLDARLGKFWLTSHPLAICNSGVVPLMERWGGEVASMWVRDRSLSDPLLKIGRPRIIEVAVPLNATKHSYMAGGAIIATFGRSRGTTPEKFAFDLYVEVALPPQAVLAVHAEGDIAFNAMGREYPEGYIDVDVGLWEELTGEGE